MSGVFPGNNNPFARQQMQGAPNANPFANNVNQPNRPAGVINFGVPVGPLNRVDSSMNDMVSNIRQQNINEQPGPVPLQSPLQQQFGSNQRFNVQWPDNRVADPNGIMDELLRRNKKQIALWQRRGTNPDIMAPISALDYEQLPEASTATMVLHRMNRLLPRRAPPEFPAYTAPNVYLQQPGVHGNVELPMGPRTSNDINEGDIVNASRNIMNLGRQLNGRNPNTYEMIGLLQRTMGFDRNQAKQMLEQLGLGE